MRLSLMVMTRNGSWRLDRMVESLRGRVDEIVIGVDTGSTDDTMRRAERLAHHVYPIDNPQGYIEPHIGPLFERCTGDWVLRLDDDELMSTNFSLSAIGRSVLHSYDLIAFPRAWVVSRSPVRYIGTGLERGELVPQFRLMRRAAEWCFTSTIHTPGFEMVPAYITPNIFMYHMTLLDQTIEERRQKYDFYQSKRDAPWNQTYLLDPEVLCDSGEATECTLAMHAPAFLIAGGAHDFPPRFDTKADGAMSE